MIDVVTVWFNRAAYVESSIMSLIEQTYRELRIIAVDDGSTDETADALRAMIPVAARRGIELDVWSKPNSGFTRSLIEAIETRSGADLVALHDAADRSLSSRLAHQHALLVSDPGHVAVGSWVRVLDEDGNLLRVRKVPSEYEFKHGGLRATRPGTHGCVLMRRSAYEQAGGYRHGFRYAQDADLWLRMNQFGKIVNVQEELYEKVRAADSVSEDPRKTALQRAYSTIAIQSAACVRKGVPDPVDDWETRGVPPRINATQYLRRMLTLVLRTAKRGRLVTASRYGAYALCIVARNRIGKDFDRQRER